MEKLKVSNFLTLEDVELEIKPINIVIGEQAQGKSVLAKLIYFFKSFWVYYRDSILNNQSEEEFTSQILKNFTDIFPRYTWLKDSFHIEYEVNNYKIGIESRIDFETSFLVNTKNDYFLLSYDPILSLKREKIRQEVIKKAKKDEQQNNRIILTSDRVFTKDQSYFQSVGNLDNYYFGIRYVEDRMLNSIFKPENIREQTVSFIPASRSFFSYIESKIFSILLKDINIDRFIKEFGYLYEDFKKYYLQLNLKPDSLNNKSINKLVNKIISGSYVRENGQDFIYYCRNNKEKKINVADASSGQQESLPILVILSALSVIDQRFFLVIEEPEAHLFPEAQKHMVELMSLIFNLTEKKNKLFITTHSPFLLTAFNHSIQAGNILKSINDKPPEEVKILQEKLFKIMPRNHILDIEDIGVYSLKNGKIKNIIEPENNLIDANIIDEVSERFGEEFDELLDLESQVCQWH